MGGFVTSAAMSAMQYVVDDKQRSAQSKIEQTAAQSDADAETAQVLQVDAADRAERQERLRRALATQRAKAGAQGTGSGASTTAALSGLAADADREDQEAEDATNLRLQRVSDQLATTKRKSLLDTTYSRYQKAISAARQGMSGVSLLED
ncbi:MAG: hypothetical protein U1E42_00425 [Rhodospirillales bacterium]